VTDISTYALAIILGVGIFGALLGGLRFLYARRVRSAARAIRKLEVREPDFQRVEGGDEADFPEEEDLIRGPALYGIPYLAWILTSVLIPAAFGIMFLQNLVGPYPVPTVGEETWFVYRAPSRFVFEGRTFAKDAVLIARHKPVEQADVRLVQAALRHKHRVDRGEAWGTLLLLAIFCTILLYHINILYPSSTEKNRNLILIYLVLLVVLWTAKIASFYGLFSPYLIPVPWAGMLIAIFINRRIVPLTMLITVIFVAIATGFDYQVFLTLLAGGLLPGAWVRKARKRSQVMLEAMVLGIVMVSVSICFSLVAGRPVSVLSPEIVASFFNGLISALMVLVFLPFIELLLDLASPFRLMELLDLNTPLLKEFFFKAPGTYQHTMVVANIAEAVANEIGANGLLVRVGAYYHDIGKIFHPEYFIENQSEGNNPHDRLGPVASAAAVRSHVILGVKLARQIGLPRIVIDFIPEHHGTATIDYFYYKSKQLESEIKSEKLFKYPGPRPQSRETAILMIVDSVEAAFRVVQSRDQETIRDLVRKIANRKMEQGELDRSGLTIGELKKVIDTLTHILKSSAHPRVKYPGNEQIEEKKPQPEESEPKKTGSVRFFSR